MYKKEELTLASLLHRLDVDEYEYIDSAPTAEELALEFNSLFNNKNTNTVNNVNSVNSYSSLHSVQNAPQALGLSIVPYGKGSGLEVTPVLATHPQIHQQESVQWSQPMSSTDEFGWNKPTELKAQSVDNWNQLWEQPQVNNERQESTQFANIPGFLAIFPQLLIDKILTLKCRGT